MPATLLHPFHTSVLNGVDLLSVVATHPLVPVAVDLGREQPNLALPLRRKATGLGPGERTRTRARLHPARACAALFGGASSRDCEGQQANDE
jgi:hypothetical protein